ncbi:hypothetical protein [Acidithiobacillus ferrivorans]|uniref:Uncharacterized protein n=1 Tax=Acidithiobacillus ferrivorans TaxID=160808 RepID=A0A7T4WE67_9PROT|nr:hypothetical protein [Acidithiobacillus ferrivorans]QQD72979.1 hypothetical protein H2515_01160 [Acidithiobacillus ferrivorans]
MTAKTEHPDDLAIDAFAEAMKAKMRRSREEKGRGGWQTATPEHLAQLLMEHINKGDPVDIANFCMMLHQNGASQYVIEQAWAEKCTSGLAKILEPGEIVENGHYLVNDGKHLYMEYIGDIKPDPENIGSYYGPLKWKTEER